MADWFKAAFIRFFAVATVALAGVFFVAVPAFADTSGNVTGWAWSGTIGWISMNCTNLGTCATASYGANIIDTPGFNDRADLKGWAWSETVGWICFGMSCSGTTPEGVAPYAQYRVVYNSQFNQFWGWAQVVSMGNDGWIALNCGNTAAGCAASNYFMSLNDANGLFTLGGGNDHWAWGSNTDGVGVGWIDFSSAYPDVQTGWIHSDLGTISCPSATYVTSGVGASYLSNLTLSFSNFWAGAGDLLECELLLPDGTKREVDSTVPTRTRNSTYTLTYTAQPGDMNQSNSLWYVDACRIADSQAGASCATEADCAPDGICDMTIHKCRQVLHTSNTVRPVYMYSVGDACEPAPQYGRCEIDTTILCLYDSDNAYHCGGTPRDPMCCPGPSILGDPLATPPYSQPRNPQKCQFAWGTCTQGGQVCFYDAQCPGGPGKCQDNSTACYKDADCAALIGTAKCTGGDRCDNIVTPWIQTVFGNVFTKKDISTTLVPPPNEYNATYCVTAKGTILNFNTQGSGGCAAMTDTSSRLALPQSANNYATVQGRLDLNGLRNGNYGPVTTVAGSSLDSTLSAYANGLGGRVIRVVGDASVNAQVIANGNAIKGSGTIFIDGGDLTINGDITYANTSVADLKQLASTGWIVVADSSGHGGNVYIDGLVKTVVGAFYSNGSSGFNSVKPPAPDSTTPLTVYGLVIAHEFQLNRIYKSLTRGTERFIYDGRAVVNPPPGFADLTKALPLITDSPGP